MSETFTVVPLNNKYHLWLEELFTLEWGSARVVTRGRLCSALALPGFVALWKGEFGGAVTYKICGKECEVVTLSSLREGIGVGTALLNAVRKSAQAADCRRLWLITTNDNAEAQRFYKRRGFRLAAVHCNAIIEARTLRPEIPVLGRNGVPIRDGIEIELQLS